jgi:hypothetical protein
MSDGAARGGVRIRSNVVFERDRWDLVPGEVLRQWRRHDRPTRLQHEEYMYYEPCSVCRRPIVEINLKGCTQCPHAPSPERTAAGYARHQQTIADAVAREAAENAEILAAAHTGNGASPGIRS